ncbi:hypothetical protein F5Y16DRAFT_371060 [Xylariaceae sp. FL0255]|nr:hypothetical protein F5Y16DRAFT_371060 [Xylariaceae sp. FL0255]
MQSAFESNPSAWPEQRLCVPTILGWVAVPTSALTRTITSEDRYSGYAFYTNTGTRHADLRLSSTSLVSRCWLRARLISAGPPTSEPRALRSRRLRQCTAKQQCRTGQKEPCTGGIESMHSSRSRDITSPRRKDSRLVLIRSKLGSISAVGL